MSIHAELSPEAQARLEAQRRNSTISSMVIAVLVVVLIGLILGIFAIQVMVKETPTIVTYESSLNEDTNLEERKVQTSLDRKPSSPSSSMAKVITANTASPVAVPVPDVDVTTPSLDFGDGNDFGSGWGDGDGTGGGFGNIPATMKKRCSKEDRLARLQETGGTPECEDAVVKALDWLKGTQSADGSWTGGNKTAMTGLALLAYLGHCETPISEKYGDTVLRAITYIVDVGMKSDGKLSTDPANKHWPYEHAIATYAIAEASTFCKQLNINVPNLFEVTQKAGQFIINNQHDKSGGWDYSYDTYGNRGGDLSITAWHIQALKACLHTGLEFKGLTRSLNKSMDYVGSMSCNDGGFAYSHANETPHAEGYRTMTGGGVLSLQMGGKGSQADVRKGIKYIMENSKFDYNTEFADLYGHYYEVQAMMNRGGKEWEWYNKMFRDQLLKNQNPDGSWKAPGGGRKIRAVGDQFTSNAHYRTCLNTLMLEVYYRFLPGTGAGTK
jgi:hypothetical protein